MNRKILNISILCIAVCSLLLISIGCSNSSNNGRSANVVNGKLVSDSDGYIYMTCYEFWSLMNGDPFRSNFLKMTNYEFADTYKDSRFAVSGTLKRSASNSLHFYDGDRSVEGGSQFDYGSPLRELGINRDMEYDGKNVIIRFTLKEGDFVYDDVRGWPYVEDISIEITS